MCELMLRRPVMQLNLLMFKKLQELPWLYLFLLTLAWLGIAEANPEWSEIRELLDGLILQRVTAGNAKLLSRSSLVTTSVGLLTYSVIISRNVLTARDTIASITMIHKPFLNQPENMKWGKSFKIHEHEYNALE